MIFELHFDVKKGTEIPCLKMSCHVFGVTMQYHKKTDIHICVMSVKIAIFLFLLPQSVSSSSLHFKYALTYS